ncbi:MAG: ferritin family protein [Fibrobacterota bacterium]
MQTMWETAIQIEEKGIDFFDTLQHNTADEGLKGVFKFLREQEEKHKEFFLRVSQNQEASMEAGEDAIAFAQKAFSKIKKNISSAAALEDSAEAYEKAKQMERDAIDFYSSLLEKTDSDEEKRIIRMIIGEEEKHEKLMEAMVGFVSRPKEWLENAEWNHLDTY